MFVISQRKTFGFHNIMIVIFVLSNWTVIYSQISTHLCTWLSMDLNFAAKHQTIYYDIVVMSVTISHKHDVWFVFTSCSLWEGSCLIYVSFVYLRIVVSKTYCVVFLLFFVILCTTFIKIVNPFRIKLKMHVYLNKDHLKKHRCPTIINREKQTDMWINS